MNYVIGLTMMKTAADTKRQPPIPNGTGQEPINVTKKKKLKEVAISRWENEGGSDADPNNGDIKCQHKKS